MKFGVLVFPGSNCDHDTYNVIEQIAHQPVTMLWHESEDLEGCDAILVPGGFAYGDYLRTGAIAHFAPVMQLAYIIGPRQVDIINLRISNVTPAGIEYTESKTGKHVTHEWTPTLRQLVREILKARAELVPQPDHDHLLTNRFGKPLTMWGIISNMQIGRAHV